MIKGGQLITSSLHSWASIILYIYLFKTGTRESTYVQKRLSRVYLLPTVPLKDTHSRRRGSPTGDYKREPFLFFKWENSQRRAAVFLDLFKLTQSFQSSWTLSFTVSVFLNTGTIKSTLGGHLNEGRQENLDASLWNVPNRLLKGSWMLLH